MDMKGGQKGFARHIKVCSQRITRFLNYFTCHKDHVSARIDENGAKTKKLWLKHGSRGLYAKILNF